MKQEVMIARQPIFDRDLNLWAYELLFRSADGVSAEDLDGTYATSTVIVNAFTEFGLDKVVGENYAFINLTRDFLLGENPLPLPPERVVLEILEDVTVDRQLIEGIKRLSKQGFKIALDDFVFEDKWLPLLELVDIVKVELPALSPSEIIEHLEILRKYDVKILAEKLETEEEFESLKDLGFDLFQGYFLAKPKVLKGQRIPSNKLNVLRLIAEIQNPEINTDEIDRLITQDVTISYKMLRYINSAFFALPGKVESVRQAIVYMGMNDIRRWASLIAMSDFNSRPSELFRLAMIRARMCEQLALTSDYDNVDMYFTLGLFSALDALLGLPMPAILNELPLSEKLQKALLTHEGDMGAVLKCTLSYEQTEWLRQSGCENLPPAQLREIYLEALAWADENTRQLW